jgi:hypothetical protein
VSLRNNPGPRPQWKWDAKHGKLTQDSKEGVDWYRYSTQIVVPKMIPFAKIILLLLISIGYFDLLLYWNVKRIHQIQLYKKIMLPSHAHTDIGRGYNIYEIQRLLWPSNSPDLNMVELCWAWMKREKKGVPSSCVEGE